MENVQSPSHPLLAQAVSRQVLSLCRIASPPPVKIMALDEKWLGCCKPLNQTEQGEVHLDECMFTEIYSVEQIRRIYLHEAAHRLVGPECGHDPVFFSIYMVLLMRSGEGLDALAFYDLQDFRRGLFLSPGQALDWSLTQAYSLVNGPLTAEQAAIEIRRRFDDYGRSPAWLRKLGRIALLVTAFTGAWALDKSNG